MEDLHAHVGALAETRRVLDGLLSRYEEFVTLGGAGERAHAER